MGETWDQQQARLRDEASRAEDSKNSREDNLRASKIGAELGVGKPKLGVGKKTAETVPASPTVVSLREEIRQYKEETLNDLRCSELDKLLRDYWASELQDVTEENWKEKEAALRQEVADEVRKCEKNLWRNSDFDAPFRRFDDHLEMLGYKYSTLEHLKWAQQTWPDIFR
jgi:hypothetical protein